jgi:hypothetical protein
MSIFYYEPFYHLDRIFDEAFRGGAAGQPGQQQRLAADENQAQKLLRPR